MNNFWNKNVVFFRQINNWKITKIQDPLTWQKWAGHTWMVPMKKRRVTKVYSAPFTIDTATFQVDNDTEKCFLISIKSIYMSIFLVLKTYFYCFWKWIFRMDWRWVFKYQIFANIIVIRIFLFVFVLFFFETNLWLGNTKIEIIQNCN